MGSKTEYIKYFLLVIGLLILSYVIKQIDILRFLGLIKSIGFIFIIFFIILAAEVYLKAFRFKLLTSSMCNLPVRGIFSIIFETLVFTVYTPGRFGEVTKLQLLKDRYGISRRKTLGVLAVERFFDFAVIVLFSLNSLLLLSGSLSVVNISIVAITALLLAAVGLKLAKKFNILQEYLEPLIQTIRGIFTSKNLVFAFGITPVIWILEALIPYMILYKLNYNVSFFMLVSIYFASSLIGLLSLIPGAVGSLELSFAYLLTNQLGIVNEDAVATILLTRGITIIFLIIGLMQFYKAKKYS